MNDLKIITVNSENIDKEHICCAISDKRGDCGVANKKAWLAEAFKKGLVFKKADVLGKVFIEYIPAEEAWCPIDAEGYMFINCLWVSGKYKGNGIGSRLLQECIKDSRDKGRKGIVVLSSPKKMPFLSDPKFLKLKGFQVCDTAVPYFELLCLKFDENAAVPSFKEYAKIGICDSNAEVAIFYSHQCPYTEKYVHLIKKVAIENEKSIEIKKYRSSEEAQKSPVPCTTYAIFLKGKFITNEILTESKFEKLLESF